MKVLEPQGPASGIDPRALLEDIKRRKLQVLQQMRDHRKTHGIYYFTPTPAQIPFFDSARSPQTRSLLFLGGNRSGKTSSSAALVVAHALGYWPWLDPAGNLIPEADRNLVPPSLETRLQTRFPVPIRIRIFGEDMEKHLGKVLLPKFREYVPQSTVASTRRNQQGIEAEWLFNNGSQVEFLSYAQDPATMEGWHGHLAWFDEPPPRPVYVATTRGLVDFNGLAVLSLTPLKEAWIADELANNPAPHIAVHTITSHQNPHVPQAALETFFSGLSEEELATRRDGRFLHLQGLVFKEFDRSVHILSRPPDLDSGYTCYVSIDTHPRTQQALVFLAVDPKDRMFVVHEVFEHGTPEQVAQWVLNFHENIHPVELALIDPSSKADENRGESTFSVIERILSTRAGIPLDPGSKDLAGGIQLMREALRSRNGQASLFVSPTCERWLWEIQRYVWDDWRGGTDSTRKNEKNKPRDKDDHLMECTRRLVQLPATFQDPQSRRDLIRACSQPRFTDPKAGY